MLVCIPYLIAPIRCYFAAFLNTARIYHKMSINFIALPIYFIAPGPPMFAGQR